jgi:hypothetical protein
MMKTTERWIEEQEVWDKLHAKHERLRRRNNRLFLYPSIALLIIWAVGSIIVKVVYGP